MSAIYGGLQSYTFGNSTTTTQPVASSSSSGSSLLPSSSSIAPHEGRRNRTSRRSSSSGIFLGGPVGPPLYSNDGDRNSTYAGSDVGSAYSPDDEPYGVASSSRRWDNHPTQQSVPLDQDDQMDIDHVSYSRRASRASVWTTDSAGKKRSRKGHRRTKDSGSTARFVDQENLDLTTEDEADSARVTERAKMRAIDDGGRRPSLPINSPASPTAYTRLHAALPLLKLAADSHAVGPSGTHTSTTSASPSTPQAHYFTPFRADPPSSNYDSSRSSSSPPQSNDSLPSASSRPRARSVRGAKPLPSLPGVMDNPNPNDWIAPWSLEARSPSLSPSEEAIPGLPPANVNPFLSSPKRATNPFMNRQNNRPATASPPPSASSLRKSSPPPRRPSTAGALPGSPVVTIQPSIPLVLNDHLPAPSPTPVRKPFTFSNDAGNAIADFDIDFILSGAVTSNNHNPNVSDVGVILPRKASLAGSIEDTFVRFVNKFDDDYGERRDQWSFRIERAAGPSSEGQGNYWQCENMGRYWVGKDEDDIAAHNASNADQGITVRFCPPDEPMKLDDRNTPGTSASFSAHWSDVGLSTSSPFYFGREASPGMNPSQRRSNVRVQVKKQHKAPAFTLYLGPKGPRALSLARPSILLAPKAYQLHNPHIPKSKLAPIPKTSFDSVTESAANLSGWPTVTLPGASTPHILGRPSMSPRKATESSTVSPNAETRNSEHHLPALLPFVRGASPHTYPPHPPMPSPSTPPVSLDMMSIAAATGRITSVHKQAFDTLSPEDGQAVLENLKQRTSFGVRIKRAFGGKERDVSGSGSLSKVESIALMAGASSQSHSSGHSHDIDSGREGSPSAVARLGKQDDRLHSNLASHEAVYEPPWMLMTPMYVREAVVAAERSMYTGFATLGLASTPAKKSGKRSANSSVSMPRKHDLTVPTTPTARRNSILDTIPSEAMCMVIPLWDLDLDVQEDKRRRRKAVDDLDLDDLDEEEEEEDREADDAPHDREAEARRQLAREMRRRRKLAPPPVKERKYLLTYYVPFQAKRQSVATPSSTITTPHSTSQENRTKKRVHASRPSAKRRNSGAGSASVPKSAAIRSFRVVARILTAAELRESGLNQPRNIVDSKRMQQQSVSYYHSLNYQRMDRRLSSSSIFGETAPAAFSAVIAVCHDRRRGVEFVPEGLDSLGLCGDGTLLGTDGTVEKLPPLFPPAHMVPVSERLTPPLNAVGKQVVEMIWAGSLALTELGV